MSLMGTLAKMALGYAAARGMDGMRDAGGFKPYLDQLTRSAGGAGAGGTGGGGLGDILGQLSKGGQGGLSDVLAELGGGKKLTNPSAPGAAGQRSVNDLEGLRGLVTAASGAASASGGDVDTAFKGLTGQREPTAREEEAAALMLRAIIQGAKADGKIDADEKSRILDVLGSDASDSEIAFVNEQISAPLDPEGLAADTPDGLKRQVFMMAMLATKADHQAEADYLKRLAQAMKIDPASLRGASA
jgi:uncharacterized membrane protein YebE (DUF533 family)